MRATKGYSKIRGVSQYCRDCVSVLITIRHYEDIIHHREKCIITTNRFTYVLYSEAVKIGTVLVLVYWYIGCNYLRINRYFCVINIDGFARLIRYSASVFYLILFHGLSTLKSYVLSLISYNFRPNYKRLQKQM